jgi:hypothetical protein
MNSQALGGGVLLTIGALLWAVYFVPIWTKRRQFSAAQKNALRIHRTLRILAETSEIPNEVRVEATARQALAHERMLEATGRSEVAEHEAKLAEARLAERKAILEARATKRRADALKRELIRQTQTVKVLRIVAAVLSLVSMIGLIAGVVLAIVGMGSLILGLSAAVCLGSILGLVAMAPRTQREQQSIPTQQRVGHRATAQRQLANSADDRAGDVPMNRPVAHQPRMRVAHQQRVASSEDVQQAQQLLEIARRQAERAARAEHAALAATPQPVATPVERVTQRAPQRPGAPARQAPEMREVVTMQPQAASGVDIRALRSMGIVDDVQQGMPDLDAALLRRRTAS